MPDLIGKTLGGYRIIEQIGLGGMATVFKAYQPSIDRYVAFKVISTHLAQDPTFVKRFQQEAKVIAKLEHLHILPVHDYGEEDGYLYLVMRFVEGGTLKDRLEGGPLSLGEARRVVSQVGSALEHAHQLGVVHRDLKPSNVLIDPQGDCYLTDFGLAKMVEGALGLTGSGVLGTPHYMAPEQSQSLKVDHRADVYAMGVVIYEMVTGQVPFDAETPFSIVLKHISEPLPLPRSIKSDLPEGVERVILKALAKDPADRYQSMRDLVTAFDQAVGAAPAETHEEAEARPIAVMPGPAPVPAGRRWVALKPLWLLAAAGLALLMLVLAGVILSQVLGRVGSSGGQVQVVLPAVTTTPATELVFPTTPMEAETATPAVSTAFTQPPPATPTATPVSPTSTPSPTVMAPLSVSATDTPQPTSTPVPPSPTAISPSTVQVTQLALYEDSANNFAWSPDSKLLVIGGYNIDVYDVQALQQTQEIRTGPAGNVTLSPDGTMLAWEDHEAVHLWDVASWSELRTLAGSGDTKGLAFSPDGAMLATATGGTVKLWEVASGKELRTIPADSTVNTVAFSPDGQTVASGGLFDVRLWDVISGNELYTLKGHSNSINSVAFSPDGKILASGSVDSTVRLWDVASGRQLRAFTGHTGQVESVAFSPDGQLLASASWDLTVKLWDVTSGAELANLTGHAGWINCVAFSPDGTILASGSGDQMRLWRIESGDAAPEPIPTLSPPVSIVTPVPLSELAISPDNVGQVTQLHLLESDSVKHIVWSPDGKLLAIATYHIYLYDAQTLKQSYVIDSVQWVYSIAFSPDGTLLAALSGDGVKLWDTAGWSELRTLAGSGDTKGLALSPDGAMLATATGGTVKLWEVASGKELRTIPADSTVNAVAFSPDGQTVASGGLFDVRLWDVISSNELYTLKGHSNSINSVAFSPDGKILASGSVDSTVRLWDVATGRQLRALSGHTDQVESVAFSPDGQLLASASWDLTVKLWDVTSGKELRTLIGHTGWVESVAFSPDGAVLASGSETVRLWGFAR